jgi:sulfur carrier protein ThiS
MRALKIFVDGKETRLKGRPKNIAELLYMLKISPQEALVRVDGKIRPEGWPLAKAEKIEVIKVVFGG